MPGAPDFVAYRLYGTLPHSLLDELRAQKESLLKQRPENGCTRAQHRARVHKRLFAVYDGWLDRTSDIRWLAEPRVAAMIRANLYHHHAVKYHLIAYCIMPNHVHVVLQPIEKTDRGAGGSPAGETRQASRLHHGETGVGEQEDGDSPLASIMHSLKSYTAHEANKFLKRSGAFWQSESYDHWIRDDDELERVVDYIAGNPVKARLAAAPHDWFFSSSHDRFLADGEQCGWLRWEG